MSDKQMISSLDKKNKKHNRIDTNQQISKHKKIIKSKPDANSNNMIYSPLSIIPYNNHLYHNQFHFKWTDHFTPFIISQTILQKYSLIPCDYNIHIVEKLIESRNSHLIAMFKDHMIMDYVDEFLKRAYKMKECVERIPKFANYYKNYLQFFCKPMFSDFPINEVIQIYGESTAKVYYNRHYGNQKKKAKLDISERLKNIFSQTIKEGIDNESSLRESSIHISETINLVGNENEFLGNNLGSNIKDGNLRMSYEESLISLLDTFQPQKNVNDNAIIRATRTVNNFIIIEMDQKQKKIQVNNDKNNSKGIGNNCRGGAETERMQTSKDINKEISYDLRTSLCNTNNTNQLSRNTGNKNGSLKTTHYSVHSNSRNKPIKLTTGQPLHMKTVSVQLHPQKKDKMLSKNNFKTQSQGRVSSDSIPSSGHIIQGQSQYQMQGQSINPGQNQASNVSNTNTIPIGNPIPISSPTNHNKKPLALTSRHITGSPCNNLNLNDVMRLTLQLYYPPSKKALRNNHYNSNSNNNNYSNNKANNNLQHQHTLSSPTINNHLSLNKSPRESSSRNNNNNKFTSNTINTNTINSHRKKESIAEEIKRNINLNINLKNIIKKNKAMSRNKPQSLIKTKTEIPIKGSHFINSKGLIATNSNKLFTSFSIFDIQQQLLNSKGIIRVNAGNNKKSLGKRRNDDPLSPIHQYQSLSQTQKYQKEGNRNSIPNANSHRHLLHTVKSSHIKQLKTRNGSKGNQHNIQLRESYKNY